MRKYTLSSRTCYPDFRNTRAQLRKWPVGLMPGTEWITECWASANIWTTCGILDFRTRIVFRMCSSSTITLIHWGRVTHICVNKLIIIGSDNGLSPGRRQAIIWTNAGILLIGPLGTNFNEIFIEIHTFSFKKMHLKMSSGKRRPFCLGLNVSIMYMALLSCVVDIQWKKY